jgi:hypothetical protein
MPYVDLPNAHDDYASLWYITNSSTGTVGGFDPSKATVLLLHPQFLDSAWLSAQFEDPRLSTSYNLIALDARHSGQTTSRLNGKQDSWTDAADVAFALEVRKNAGFFFTVQYRSSVPHTPTPPFSYPRQRDRRLIHPPFVNRIFRRSVSPLCTSGRVNYSQRPARCVSRRCERSPIIGIVRLLIAYLVSMIRHLNWGSQLPRKVPELDTAHGALRTRRVRIPIDHLSFELSLTLAPLSSHYNLNEIVHSWCYAQEMETIEHAFMNLVATLCGQVRSTLHTSRCAHQ